MLLPPSHVQKPSFGGGKSEHMGFDSKIGYGYLKSNISSIH